MTFGSKNSEEERGKPEGFAPLLLGLFYSGFDKLTVGVNVIEEVNETIGIFVDPVLKFGALLSFLAIPYDRPSTVQYRATGIHSIDITS